MFPAFRTFAIIALFLGLGFAFPGCDKISRQPDPGEPAFAAIRAQLKALNKRDATGALAMMHPEAPGLDDTRATTQEVTATFDLVYMVQNLSLESMTDEEAKVRFTQITQKVSGPEFRNNRVVGIHTLRKYEGAWKLYYTQVLNIEYLDK